MPSARVNISGFGSVIKGLSKISGKTFTDVLKAESGHILKGAIGSSRPATIEPRKYKGKERGGIVKFNLTEGFSEQGGEGTKKLIKKDGKIYHIGRPELLTKYSDERAFPKTPQKGVGRGRGVHPKRGGKVWKRPLPTQGWLKRKGFYDDLNKRYARTRKKINNRGMTAGQFWYMSEKLKIKMPPRTKYKKLISSPRVKSLVRPFCFPKLITWKDAGTKAEIILESKGLKVSGYNNSQRKLMQATGARIRLFTRAVREDFISDMKKFMPSRYPLIFDK